ncbi:MAG: type II secretion system protein [Verrucomicrobium sp.]|nr:type II secretion system protein [Verrucomicrobium sp.]
MSLHTKNRNASAFTLIELLVVISIIAILASLALPALDNARTQAQGVQIVSNARQVYIAMQAASSDAAQSGLGGIGFPADAGPQTTPTAYFQNVLIANDYLKAGDLRVLSAPGYPAVVGTNTLTAANNAFNLGNTGSIDAGTAVLIYTKNWSWGQDPKETKQPFGNKGAVILHKGGDGAFWKANVAKKTDGTIGTQPAGTPAWITE